MIASVCEMMCLNFIITDSEKNLNDTHSIVFVKLERYKIWIRTRFTYDNHFYSHNFTISDKGRYHFLLAEKMLNAIKL